MKHKLMRTRKPIQSSTLRSMEKMRDYMPKTIGFCFKWNRSSVLCTEQNMLKKLLPGLGVVTNMAKFSYSIESIWPKHTPIMETTYWCSYIPNFRVLWHILSSKKAFKIEVHAWAYWPITHQLNPIIHASILKSLML